MVNYKIFTIFWLQLLSHNLLAEELVCDEVPHIPLCCFVENGTFTTADDIIYTKFDKNFTTLDMFNSELEFIFHNLFVVFPKLQSFRMIHCIFSTIRPNDFNGANNLLEIILANTTIEALKNNSFQGAKQLQVLSITNGNLNKIGKDAFRGLSILDQLNLHKNQLKSLESGIFDGLVSLQTFNCYFNSLTEIPADLFNKTRKLRAIDLSTNKIISIDNKTFGNLKFLQLINLNDNQLSSLQAPFVQHLEVKNNLIDNFFIPNYLIQLSIANNSLSKLSCDVDLNLTIFYGSHNNLTDLRCIKNMDQLTNLDISFNKITKLNKTSLARLTKVRYLHLKGNPKQTYTTYMFSPMKALVTLSVNELKNYKVLKRSVPNLNQVWLTTDTWDCSRLKKVAEILTNQKISYESSDRFLNFKRFKCQIPFPKILD